MDRSLHVTIVACALVRAASALMPTPPFAFVNRPVGRREKSQRADPGPDTDARPDEFVAAALIRATRTCGYTARRAHACAHRGPQQASANPAAGIEDAHPSDLR